jgi:hypothetical protein
MLGLLNKYKKQIVYVIVGLFLLYGIIWITTRKPQIPAEYKAAIDSLTKANAALAAQQKQLDSTITVYEGEVKEIRDLPEDMGYGVVYECSNNGSTWKAGDMLGKTEVQLQKISEAKWTKEYKDSIDCNNPKGFSQRAHCQSLKKK